MNNDFEKLTKTHRTMKTFTMFILSLVPLVSCQSSWSENEIIDARLTRETISMIVIEHKLNQIKSITNPSLIEGEWKQIVHMITWVNDTEPVSYGSTFTYGVNGTD